MRAQAWRAEEARHTAGDAALFVQPGDPDCLAGALRGVLASPAAAAALVEAGKARAAQLDWRVLAPKILTWYESTQGPSSA